MRVFLILGVGLLFMILLSWPNFKLKVYSHSLHDETNFRILITENEFSNQKNK